MPLKSPAKRLMANRPDFSRESVGIICGCDEAGRGPLAGPVTAACVFISHEKRHLKIWEQVRDSKLLKPIQREELFAAIQENSCFGINSASTKEITDLNILHAAMLAMQRATEEMCQRFSIRPDLVLIDGKYKPAFPYPVQPVIKGDMLSVSIAAASILAKVTRDRIMQDLHAEHPHYGWNTNAGYGTAKHLKAIQEHGITEHHRAGFSPIKEMLAS